MSMTEQLIKNMENIVDPNDAQDLLDKIMDMMISKQKNDQIHDILTRLLYDIFNPSNQYWRLAFKNSYEVNLMKIKNILTSNGINNILLYDTMVELLKICGQINYEKRYDLKKIHQNILKELFSHVLINDNIYDILTSTLINEDIMIMQARIKEFIYFPSKFGNILEDQIANVLNHELYYKSIIEALCKFIRNYHNESIVPSIIYGIKFMIEKLITHGQLRIIIDVIMQNIFLERDIHQEGIQIKIQEPFLDFLKIYKIGHDPIQKIVKELIKTWSKSSFYSLKQQDIIELLYELLDDHLHSEILHFLTSKLMVDQIISFSAYTIIIPLVQKFDSKNMTKNLTIEFFKSLVVYWSDSKFTRNSTLKHQQYVSNLLRGVLFMLKAEDILQQPQIGYLQDGIYDRLNYMTNDHSGIIKQSAEIVWSAMIRIIHVNDQINLLEKEKICDFYFECDNETIEQIPIDKYKKINSTEEPIIKSNDSQQYSQIIQNQINIIKDKSKIEDDEFEIIEPIESIPIITSKKPKFLYDCLLGLRSDNKERIENAIYNTASLIRKNLKDIDVIAEELAITLCKMNNQFDIVNFETKRIDALIALVVLVPELISKKLISRLFYSEASLGEKLLLMEILEKAAKELSSNPDKYKPIKKNDGDNSDDDDGEIYIKPIIKKIYTEEQKKLQAKNEIINDRIEKNSRRWGDTKILYNKRMLADEKLKSIDRKDLIIINNSTTNQYFIARFNSICNYFVFPLIISARKETRLFLRETLLLGRLIRLLGCYVEYSKNAPMFYQIIEEVIDFLIGYIKIVNDELCLKEIIQTIYKITIFINKRVILSYENIITKLLVISKLITPDNMNKKFEKFKVLIYEITKNIQDIFEINASNLILQGKFLKFKMEFMKQNLLERIFDKIDILF